MPKRILVVDDSSVIRNMTAEALAQGGYEVVHGRDGVEGYNRWKADPAIALIICDINMPRMNGLDLLDKIKAETQAAQLPILMLTTEGQRSLIERARKAGALGWIVKPFKAVSLLAAVNKILSR